MALIPSNFSWVTLIVGILIGWFVIGRVLASLSGAVAKTKSANSK